MKTLIENFPAQLKLALEIGKKAKLSFTNNVFNQVFVSGLGGSGIGASIVQDYVFDLLSIPFVVNKHYFIPKTVNKDTLFIACSYSGNTEETINSAILALKAKANIVCITSGGALEDFAIKNKLNLILIPEGFPPRSCLGYSLVQILFTLKKAKLINSSFEKQIEDSIELIHKESKSIKAVAKNLAKKFTGRQIAIYGIAGQEGLAVRFRQQLNENAKALAWHNVIPEMTHNEIVGWRNANENVAVVFCYQEKDYDRNIKRLQILKSVIKKHNTNISEIVSKGNSHWEKVFYFVHLTDWVSVFLADNNHQDATEVKVIDHLKSNMSKK